MNFINELEWRGMIHTVMPGTEKIFENEKVVAYVGIDPTADSLHVGHLVSIMMLKHLQRCGHQPIILLGGATGMIGDPSMKSAERNLLDEDTLRNNQNAIKKQLSKFLNFDDKSDNAAILVNNYDWMKEFSFITFIREIGKHITVNYMMAKDSVKKRLSGEAKEGMSFTEFSYQLIQGYDFLYLNEKYSCKVQMGGADQWGNITTGTELIRKKNGKEAFAITCPLITKADGGKFGKTESGNIWLSAERTNPFEFYQFWLNTSDDDAVKYIKIFTTLSETEITNLINSHKEQPHLRLLQKKLAEELTIMVHSKEDYNDAILASSILFENLSKETLNSLNEKTILNGYCGCQQFNVSKSKLNISVMDLLSEETTIFPSKAELKRTVQGNGLSINKEKIIDEKTEINLNSLILNKFLLIQKGKKNHYLIIFE